MAKEEIDHKGWRIDVMRHGGGWRAFIYRPGSTVAEETIPNGPDRNAVIGIAKKLIDKTP